MWNGNPAGTDPAILSGSVIDPGAPEGYLFGNLLGDMERPVLDAEGELDTPDAVDESDPMILGGHVSADDVRRILAGDPVEDGTYVIAGMLYTPVAP